MLDKLQIYVSIIAAVAIAIVSLLQSVSLITLCTRLIFVIILSYILGCIQKSYLKKTVFFEEKEEEAVPEVMEDMSIGNLDSDFMAMDDELDQVNR